METPQQQAEREEAEARAAEVKRRQDAAEAARRKTNARISDAIRAGRKTKSTAIPKTGEEMNDAIRSAAGKKPGS